MLSEEDRTALRKVFDEQLAGPVELVLFTKSPPLISRSSFESFVPRPSPSEAQAAYSRSARSIAWNLPRFPVLTRMASGPPRPGIGALLKSVT